ncbi:MAG: ATP-dependent helicase [Clostridiaceae bacterium]
MKEYKLDKNQEKAIEINVKDVLVSASPGSGKTAIIIRRCNYLLKNNNVSYRNILVLTYTKNAANHMKNEYIKNFKENCPHFSTIHSFLYEILRNNNKKINIIDENTKNELIKQVLNKYVDYISINKINNIKNMISQYKISNFNKSKLNIGISEEIFYICYEKYSKYLSDNKLMDFDDLSLFSYKLFNENPQILKEYRNRYKYILVDEFQDCDEMEIKFLKLIAEGNSFFAVGDEDQSIYSFKGASPKYIINFNEYFKNGRVIYLNNNYRCPEKIVERSCDLIEFNKERTGRKIYSKSFNNKDMNIMHFENEKKQAEKIVDDIDKANNKNNLSDFAVLFRTREEGDLIKCEMLNKNISFNFCGIQQNIYNHFIFQDLYLYLKFLQQPYNLDIFNSIANKPNRFISKLNLTKLKRKNNSYGVISSFYALDTVSLSEFKGIKLMERALNKIKKSQGEKILDIFLKKLKYISYLETQGGIEKYKNAIEALKNICIEEKNISNIIKRIEINKGENIINKNSVTLSTIHSVKGEEFKRVYILNCIENTFPYYKNKNEEEERRIFYVAITRTLDELYLCVPEYMENLKTKPSKYLKEIKVE